MRNVVEMMKKQPHNCGPKIEVTHPNVPTGSEEHLVGIQAQSPPYHGEDNPAFTFDSKTLFDRAPSRVDAISPASEPPALAALPPLRRASYSPFVPATDSLTVPAFDKRRQSLSSAWGRDNSGAGTGLLGSPKRRHKPPQSLSIDNVTSDCRSQAIPSPGLLSTHSMWNTSDLMLTPSHHADPDSVSNLMGTSSLSNVSGSLGERMHELVRAFSSRTQRCKERISQPPTPSSTSSYDAKSAVSALEEQVQPRPIRLGYFIPMGSRSSEAFSDTGQEEFVGVGHCRFKVPRWCKRFRFPGTMEPYSKLYMAWLFVVMMAYLYNATVIPLRAVFPYQTRQNWLCWLVADYICDLIYLIDIIVFKTRLRFTINGMVETDYQKTKKHYVKKWIFKFDVLSMMPLDLIYFAVDKPWMRKYAWLRLPRMLKIQTFWEFYTRCDQAAKSSAHAIRIIKTMTYMLYLIHIETCGYYAVSEYEGLNSNRWVYNAQGNAYIRCFYLATKTATSIGNNPKPTNTLEYMFMTLYWLSGVFVFALLIGQIRDIVEAAGQVKESYRKKMDSALNYMQGINISEEIQDRARKWFLYNWEQSKTIDERSLVAALPLKLQTDLAINVHFNTLSKVQLFQDCERNLLYDLVLKLKPNLFLPGDYVCRKGEVGKEMYIVSQGHVEVVGGENNEVVLATLTEGSVFGEISLLAMSGRGNRRTADVRSSGYTNVFTLSKTDFEEAMNEYPDAQKLLKKRAKKLLRENAKKIEKKSAKSETEEIIKTPNETPKMVKTVIQVLKPESMTAKKLHSSIKRTSTSSGSHHLQVPGPVHKGPRPQDHAKSNMAFDFSDEQIKPSIKTESYDDADTDDDDDELLVVERIEQNLPQPDINDNDVDDFLNGDDIGDENEGDDDDDFLDDPSGADQEMNFEQEFFENVMSELRAQAVIGRDEVTGEDVECPTRTERKRKGQDEEDEEGEEDEEDDEEGEEDDEEWKEGRRRRKSSSNSEASGKSSDGKEGSRKGGGGRRKRGKRKVGGDTEEKESTGEAGRKTSDETAGHRKTSGESRGSRKTSGESRGSRKTSGETEGSRKTSVETEGSRKTSVETEGSRKTSGETEGSRKTSVETEGSRKTSVETEGSRKTSGETEGSRKTSVETEGSRKTSGETEGSRKTSVETEGSRKTSVETEGSRKTSGETEGSRKTSGETEGSRKTSVETEGSRKTSGETEGSRKTSGETEGRRAMSGEKARKRSGRKAEVSGADDDDLTCSSSVDSLDSGVPSMKRSASQSKESLNSADLTGAAHRPQQRHGGDKGQGASSLGWHGDGAGEGEDRSEVSARHPLGHLVTVGLGGVCEQDSSALSTTSCARKISTVSVQQLPSHVGGAFSALASASSLNISSTATGSAGDDLGQVNGVSSRKTSGESPCKIPPENQITCAVEVHREKTTKTTTASTARAEQPAVAATTPTSTPRDSPAPTTRSPLPHELYHMRETIV